MKRLPDFEQLRLFIHVAESGSFSEASRLLAIPVSTVSRKIGELERFLGEKLLYRSTRQLSLTPEGRFYFERSLGMVREYESWHHLLAEREAEPAGQLRLTAPISYGVFRLPPLLKIYREKYPRVDVFLMLRNELVDLVGERIDLALRLGPLSDSSLKARKIGVMRYLICASPDYLERAGTPQTPEALAQHECILLANRSGPIDWPMERQGGPGQQQVHGSMTLNEPMAARTLCLAGMGITRLPDFLIIDELETGRLVPLLTSYTPPGRDIFAVYTEGALLSPKTRAMLEILLDKS